MNSNNIYYDEITGIIYIDLGNNLKYPISNLSYTKNKFEELKSNISEFGKLSFEKLEKNISEINGYLEYCKELGLYSDDTSIKLIEKGGKILDIKNLVEKIKIDYSNKESLLQAIVSRSLELGTTNLINSAYMAIAIATKNPMFIIIGNELAESNGSYANASIDYLWDPEKRDILFQALRSLSGSEIEYETINNTKYGYIKYQILTSGQTKIIGDINVVSKIWNNGSNIHIKDFEANIGSEFGNKIYYFNNIVTIHTLSMSDALQDIKKLAKYFPSLYKTVETNVMDGLNRIYKMNLYNFNPELNRRNFSADELINANPNFNGRISDDGTFVLLGVGESIDDIKYPLIGNEKNNIINGDENDNRILGNGGNDIIYGGSGFENIDGGDGDDIISTGDPDSSFLDFILNKHDIVHGGNGNDIIYGGKGNDKLYGDEGNDNIYGYEGNDEIDAGNGDDLIDGGNGNDTINGGDGNDILKGGNGNDTLIGGAGSDTLSGGDGDDTLSAGDSEKDKLSGGSGNDTLIGYKNVYLDGGTGFDTYYIKSGKIKDSDGKGIINDIKGTFNETEKGTEIYTQGAYTYDNRSKKLTGNGLDISVDLSGGRFSIELVRTDYVRPRRDPLILDLDGDGIETTSVNNGVNYDFLADGIKEKTGWVGKDDGFLVLDKNSNGKIDNDSEFFGEGQSLKNGEKSTGGFESLGEYDGNGDKIINSNDEIYSQLRIWQDKNQNGITDEGELKTLKELGIKSISLEALQKNITTSTGNILREEGTYTLESGEERKIGEFLFQTSVLEATEEELELTDEVKNLADINGYGGNFSLHQAMMRDSELKNLVIEFGNLEGAQDKLIKVGEIVNKWYGESTKDKIIKIYGEPYFNNINNRGESISAPIFSKIESDIIKNVYFSLIQQTSLKGIFDEVNPSFNEESKEWEIDLGNIKEIFEKEIETNGSNGLKKLEEFISAYQMIYSEKSNFEEFKKYFSEKYNRGFMEIDENINIKIGSIGDDTLNSGEGSDILVGGIGNDKLNGGAGDDIYIFNKGDGQDIINDEKDYDANIKYYYNAGNDTLRFGKDITKEDILMKQEGSNVIVGIKEEGKTFEELSDKITLTNWMNKNARIENFEFVDGTKLGIQEILKLFGTFEDNTFGWTESILEASFEQGNDKVITGNYNDVIHLGSGDDEVSSQGGDDSLYGEEGNDTLNSGEGSDILVGGIGNDKLNGGAGDDIYIFNKGDGQDIINDEKDYDANIKYYYNAGNDTLRFGKDITKEDILMKQEGSNVIVGIKEEGKTFEELSDKITLTNWMNKNARIENFEFVGGTKLGIQEILKLFGTFEDNTFGWTESILEASFEQGNDKVITGNYNDVIHLGSGDDEVSSQGGDDSLYGEEGNDTLNSGEGSDILVGGIGNDKLNGGAGDDVYIFNKGDGQDIINDEKDYDANIKYYYNAGNDTLRFGKDITKEDILMKQVGSDVIVGLKEEAKTFEELSDKITLTNWMNKNARIENFEFVDGTKLNMNNLMDLCQYLGHNFFRFLRIFFLKFYRT